ncbi:AAA family ATPase [Corynebacterium cystitidis]|uniref:AAA family ATPase n=1 Tax=Corynebacterium cystitidis TaxID=35757 RepID=UPI00211EFBA4|nr:AAA family ATPase [Corynebacterium cystitidis]
MVGKGPWQIDKLEIRNFRNYDNLSIDFAPDVTLLIGENGAGKTAILDALSVLLTVPVSAFGQSGVPITNDDVHAVPRNLESVEAVATNTSVFPVSLSVTAQVGGRRWTWSREKNQQRAIPL